MFIWIRNKNTCAFTFIVTANNCVYSDDKIMTRWHWIKKWAINKIKVVRCGDIWGIKSKSKVHPRTGHDDPERVEVYLYSFFSLSARCRGWSTPRPDRFTHGKETRYPLYRMPSGPQGLAVLKYLMLSVKVPSSKIRACRILS